MNLPQLKERIDRAPLDDEAKNYLLILFSRFDDRSLAPILELCQDNPSWLITFSRNLMAKIEAVEQGDSAAWERIVEEERKLLSELPA
jgi:hypothetical protein